MSKIREILLVALVSYEMIALAGVIVVAILFPWTLISLGNKVKGAELEIFFALLAAPFVLVGVGFKLSIGVLNPERMRDVLVDWPGYWRLKIRIKIGLFFIVAGIAAWILGWLVFLPVDLLVGAAVAMAGLLIAVTSFLTIANARIDVQDILEGQ